MGAAESTEACSSGSNTSVGRSAGSGKPENTIAPSISLTDDFRRSGGQTENAMRQLARLGPRMVTLSLVVALIVAWGISYQAPAVGTFHDDAVLIASAKSLAGGNGYRIPSLPEEIAQTKYPIAFPVVLAVVWKLFPGFPANIPYLKIVPLMFALLWFGVTYIYVIEQSERSATATSVVLLTAASPWVIFLGTTVLSETMFAFFLMTSLLLLRRIERTSEEGGWNLIVFSAIFSGFTCLVRAAALPLLVAAVAALLLRKRFRSAVIYATIVAVVVAPWAIWQSNNTDTGSAYSYYSAQAYKEWNLLYSYSLPEKAQIAALNVFLQLLWPTDHFGIQRGVLGLGICLLIAGLVFFGLTYRIRREWSVTDVFLLFYLGMMVLWPWPPARFMSPVLPLLILLGIQGLNWTIGRIRQTAAKPVARLAVFALLVVSIAVADYKVAKQSINLGAVYPTASGYNDWRHFEDMYRWIDANLPDDAIVNCILDPTLYLYTGRKAVRGYSLDARRLFYRKDGEGAAGSVAGYLRKISVSGTTHLVSMPNKLFSESDSLERLIDEINESHPGLLKLLRTGPDHSYRVFAIDRTLLPG